MNNFNLDYEGAPAGYYPADSGNQSQSPDPEMASDAYVSGETPNTNTYYKVYDTREAFQSDVDNMIGKRIYGLKAENEKLKQIIKKLFEAIEKDRVMDARLRKAFEEQSKQISAKNQMLLKEQERLHSLTQDFLDAICDQVMVLAANEEDFDMNECVDNPIFLSILSHLYCDPETCGNCVELAYKSVYADDCLKRSLKKETDKLLSTIKSGGYRIAEGATNKTAPVIHKIDPAKLSPEQFRELKEKIIRGEAVNLN